MIKTCKTCSGKTRVPVHDATSNINMMKRCPACRVKCTECNGRGWHIGDCHPWETCGVCDGTGCLPRGSD